MPDEHEHNSNGTVREYTITVGDEKITYRMVKCTCGQVVENIIIHREPK